MHLILWEFQPRPGKAAEFERGYGAGGEWAKLFGRSPEYRGTELLRSADGRTFLTIDRWTSADAFAAFQREWQRAYDELDRHFEALTERETLVGRFDTV